MENALSSAVISEASTGRTDVSISVKPTMVDKGNMFGRVIFKHASTQTVEHLKSIGTCTPQVISKDVGVSTLKNLYKNKSIETTAVQTRDVSMATEKLAPGINPASQTAVDAGFDTSIETQGDFQDESFRISEYSDESQEYSSGSTDESESYTDKYIVFWSMLCQLFTCCLTCHKSAYVASKKVIGSLLSVTLFCVDGHTSIWKSQPLLNKMPLGNLLLASSVVFTGNTYGRIKELLEVLSVACISKTSFMELQKKFVFPVINEFFIKQKEEIVDYLKWQNRPLDVSGDGRCDSPGFTAKYGAYTVMNTENDKILDFSLTQVSQTTSSVAMEKLGFVNVLEKIENEGLRIRSITTDRHVQIRAYLAKSRTDIIHQFDIWHVARSIKKKLSKKAKTKSCEELGPWIKSIINHFWWSCKGCNNDYNLLKEKWTSVLFHVRNVHRWHNYELFKMCEHGPLSKSDSKDINWLQEGTPSFHAVEQVVLDKTLIKDLRHLTEYHHTGNLEVYHSLLNKYCPKRQHFYFASMNARHQLAIMDHNSGTDRPQSVNKSGKPVFKYQFSKITKQWVEKPVKVQKKRFYLGEMMERVQEIKLNDLDLPAASLPKTPKNIAPVPRPDISDMKRSSRFEN